MHCVVKIAARRRKLEIGPEEQRVDEGLSVIDKIARQKGRESCDGCKQRHCEECGQDPSGAPCVKILVRELPLFRGLENDRSNQIPGNDEENVDTDIASREHLAPGVKQNHRYDSDGSQSVDLFAITNRSHHWSRQSCSLLRQRLGWSL